MSKLMMVVSSFLMATASFAIPNPSLMNCLRSGGNYETRVDMSGNQDGVCMFDQNGMKSECGGWAYFRGECAPGECSQWSVTTHSCER